MIGVEPGMIIGTRAQVLAVLFVQDMWRRFKQPTVRFITSRKRQSTPDSAERSSLEPAIATATCTLAGRSQRHTEHALQRAARELHGKLDGVADLVLCFCTEHHELPDLRAAALTVFGGIPFAASTTSGGVVTHDARCHVDGGSDTSAVLALWAIRALCCFKPLRAHPCHGASPPSQC